MKRIPRHTHCLAKGTLGTHRNRILHETGGFSLTELLAVVGIMLVLLGLSVASMMGIRTPGAYDATVGQVMASFEEARLRAIESRQTIHVGLAGTDHVDPERRRRAFIFYRDLSMEELNGMATPPPAGTVVPVTPWIELPVGFYFDTGLANSLMVDTGATKTLTGLPGMASGAQTELQVLAFGSLGQVVWPSSGTSRIRIMEGHYDPTTDTMVERAPAKPSEIQVVELARLTGRVSYTHLPPNPTPNP